MRSEITEISYSTALTFELATQYGFLTLGAPTFPSLRKEVIYKTESDSVGVLVFMQYKVSDRIGGTGSSLKEVWGIPYYRFLIHPKNRGKRHTLLKNLESMDVFAYYTAPEFHTIGGLYGSLINRRVLVNSTFWSPSAIGRLADKERNTLSYKPDIPYGVLEPGNYKIDNAIKGTSLLGTLRQSFESVRSKVIDAPRLVDLGDRMLENYLDIFHSIRGQKLINDIRISRERIEPRDYLSLISTLLYDCHVYIVPGDQTPGTTDQA